MNLLIRWLLSALAVMAAGYLLNGIHIDTFMTALMVALVLGIINVTIKPLVLLLTLPITILTLGLFTIVINALMILLTSAIVKGFHVDSFWWAILFSIVLAIINYFLNKFAED